MYQEPPFAYCWAGRCWRCWPWRCWCHLSGAAVPPALASHKADADGLCEGRAWVATMRVIRCTRSRHIERACARPLRGWRRRRRRRARSIARILWTVQRDPIAECVDHHRIVCGKNGFRIVSPWRYDLKLFRVRSSRLVSNCHYYLAVGRPVCQRAPVCHFGSKHNMRHFSVDRESQHRAAPARLLVVLPMERHVRWRFQQVKQATIWSPQSGCTRARPAWIARAG